MPDQPISLGIIPCSLRAASANRGLARAAADLAPANTQLILIDDLPLFSEDHEAEAAEPTLEVARKLRGQVRELDAILICTPEYDAYPPAMTVNLLNWLSRAPEPPLRGKSVAVAGAAAGFRGSRRSQAHVRQILEVMGARTVEQHYYSQIGDRFSPASGDLTDVHERTRLAEFLSAAVAEIRSTSA